MKIFLLILKVLGAILLILILSISGFLWLSPQFGGNHSEEALKSYRNSPNHNGRHFQNKVPTQVDTSDPEARRSITALLFEFMNPPADKNPAVPLPSQDLEPSQLEDDTFVWFGHSTLLIKTNGQIILIDPVFNNASPIPGTIPPFEMTHQPAISDLPEKIDVLLISHDHYDHLDYQAIQQLDARVSIFLVPLGIKSHLTSWGISKQKIREFDWYDQLILNNVSFTATPSRHFSGRSLNDRFSTLWCSWIVQSLTLNVFLSGDSGYFNEFESIGQKYGPFDIAFLENGAYNEDWSQIHMFPEQSVQASIDLNAQAFFPIHWGKFDLARHTWKDPITRAYQAAKKKQVKIITPYIGEVFDLQNPPLRTWWNQLD